MASQLAEELKFIANQAEAGAESPSFLASTARLKACPDTKHSRFQPSLRDCSSSVSRPRIASWAKFSRPFGTFVAFSAGSKVVPRYKTGIFSRLFSNCPRTPVALHGKTVPQRLKPINLARSYGTAQSRALRSRSPLGFLGVCSCSCCRWKRPFGTIPIFFAPLKLVCVASAQ
jgi:hypothetical protein